MGISGSVGCSRESRKQKLMESADRYYDSGKYAEAAIQYQNAIKLDPRFADAHHKLARAFLRSGNFNGTYTELLRTIELQPDNYQAQVDLGTFLLAAKETGQAAARADAILEKQPNNPDAHALKASVLSATGKFQDALAEMQKAVSLGPKRADLLLALATLQRSSHDDASAEATIRKAMEADPKSADAITALADLLTQQKRYAEAEKVIKQSILLDPMSPKLRADLAQAYLRQGDSASAERTLQEAKHDLSYTSEGYRLLGDFYFDTGNLDKAITEYASLRTEHPQDLQVTKNYTTLLILKGRLDEADKIASDILKRNPRDVEGLIARGRILIARGQFLEAQVALEKAIQSEPGDAPAHLYLGKAYAGAGNLERAEVQWRLAVRLRPSLTEGQTFLAQLAEQRGDTASLREAADALVQYAPQSASGYVYRAMASASKGGGSGVEPDLQRAIDLAPKDPWPLTTMGDLRTGQHRFAEAEKFYDQALAINPNYLPAAKNLLAILAAQNQTDRAVLRADAMIKSSSESSILHQLKGQLLLSKKDFKGAAGELSRAIELDKNNLDAATILAQIEVENGDVNVAIAEFERALRVNQHDARTYIMLGTAYERAGKWQQAQDVYKRVLQFQPDQAVATNNLAYLMLEHGGDVDVALTMAQTARKGLPDLAMTADTLAWAYYKKGVYQSSVDLLEGALKQEPDNPNIHYHLGLAYRESHNWVKAQEHLRKALELDPKSPHAFEIRKALGVTG